MNTWKKLFALLLVPVLALSLLGGCQTPATSDASSGTPGPAPAGAPGPHTIAANNWGVGAYPLDIIFESLSPLKESTGDLTVDLANNEFKADKVISDLQNQLTSGTDGVLFLGMTQTIFPTAAQLCQQSKVPFVFHANVPAEADMAAIQSNPYYAGSVIAQEYSAGKAIGEIAASDGNRTAIISAAALGDYTHDSRIAGFTDAFEAGGGEVLYVSHSADPSEGVQKANDFMTAYPDADMVYCAGGDYVSATISAMASQTSVHYKVYGTDLSPEVAQCILDGTAEAVNGGQWISGSLAAALLVNRLDGHPILNENGQAPLFDNLNLILLDKSNAQGFIDLMTSGGLLTKEDFDTLLYRSNPDLDYQTFYDFIGSIDTMVYERMK